MKSRILVIDDEAAIRDSLRMILEYEGYEFLGAPTGQEGLALAERDTPDLVFLDIKMPGMDGLDVLQRLRAADESLPVVMISGHATVTTAVEATRRGAFDFIEKPLASERVLVTIRNALDRSRLADENRSLKRAVEVRHQIVGESPSLKKVTDAVKRAAPTSATVLITGESGVGKELVARAIHRNSLRSRERFVQVNCAAIPDDLIEAELFGHEKGSFTGATEKQIGKFEQADKGHDLPRRDRRHEPEDAGQGAARAAGGRGRAPRVRTDDQGGRAGHRGHQQGPRRGNRRRELPRGPLLSARVIPISVPPLRERRDDIPLLVRHFVELFSRDNNFRPKRVTPPAMDLLQKYRWKGNIRELRNALERLIIMTPNDTVDVADLPESIRTDAPQRPAGAGEAAEPPAKAGTLREHKELAERVFLVQKLRETGWNISKTAELIDTPRSNLYKKLEQYQISQETDG